MFKPSHLSQDCTVIPPFPFPVFQSLRMAHAETNGHGVHGNTVNGLALSSNSVNSKATWKPSLAVAIDSDVAVVEFPGGHHTNSFTSPGWANSRPF